MAAAKKKKKRSLFCAALVAGTINKLEQSILGLRYLWEQASPSIYGKQFYLCLILEGEESLQSGAPFSGPGIGWCVKVRLH